MDMNEKIKDLKKKFNLSDEDLKKPLPIPTKWSKPFWEGTKEHKLLLKRCKECGHIDHPPYLYCTECMSENSEWVEASGRATLYAFAVNEYGVPFPFMADLPYVVALVDLSRRAEDALQHRRMRSEETEKRHGTGGCV